VVKASEGEGGKKREFQQTKRLEKGHAGVLHQSVQKKSWGENEAKQRLVSIPEVGQIKNGKCRGGGGTKTTRPTKIPSRFR